MIALVLLCMLGISLTVLGNMFLINDANNVISGIDYVVNLNDGAGVKGQ